MQVLGISAFYHDSAAAIVKDGDIVAAAQEERFSRRKFDAGFPARAIAYCLDAVGVGLDQLDYIGFYDKPLLTFDRLMETYFAYAPAGFQSFARAIPVWVKEKLLLESILLKELSRLDRGQPDRKRLLFGNHHLSHAASAFYPSPFDRASILIMDGVGEWATTSLGLGTGTDIELFKEIRFPHSLGMLYSAFTYYLGFKVNDGEYKVMGLAPYGEPRYVNTIYEHLIDLKPDGSFRLDMEYFDYCAGLTMTNQRFADLFGGAPPRNSESPLNQRDMDLAHSVQVVLEEAVLRICATLVRETGERRLCLAGGVALNCVVNGKLLRSNIVDELWIQPAAGDAGAAIGVALAIDHVTGGTPRRPSGGADHMKGSFLGPDFDAEAIRGTLEGFGAVWREPGDDALIEAVAEALAKDKVVGWFQGKMEFGPRSLGNRSILANARSPDMQKVLNLTIKYREGFRPFAPAVLSDRVAEYFDHDRDSPYMLLVADVKEERRRVLTDGEAAKRGLDRLNVARSDIPAVTHVDGSARIQTVHRDTNPRFHALLEAFAAKTGLGVLVNTSFNVRDEPIVCSPEDAYRCFMATEMDMLAMGRFLLTKEEQ